MLFLLYLLLQDKHFWQTQANLVVQAASGETIQMANLVPPPSTLTPPHSSKMCRYGETCTRIGCRFRHRGTDSTTETNPTPSPSPAGASSVSATPPNKSNSHLYFTHSWLPMHIRIQLNNEGEIAVNKANSSDTYDKTVKKLKYFGNIETVYNPGNPEKKRHKSRIYTYMHCVSIFSVSFICLYFGSFFLGYLTINKHFQC